MLQSKNIHNKNVTVQELSQELDFQYLELRESIFSSAFFGSAQKRITIRINLWMAKLDHIITNPTWKRNRNNYAKIINLMCDCEVIVGPFSSLPPQGDIPKLTKTQVNKLIDQVQRFVKLERSKGGNEVDSEDGDRNETLRPHEYWQNIKSMRTMIKQSPKDGIIEDSYICVKELQQMSLKNKLENSRQIQNRLRQSLYFLQETKSLKSMQLRQNKQNKSHLNIKDDQTSHQQSCSKRNYPKQAKKVSININNLSNGMMKKGTGGLKESIKSVENMNKGNSSYCYLLSSKQTYNPNDNLQAYRDNYQSFSIENQTLKTEYYENDQSNNQDDNQKSNHFQSTSEYNFNEDLAEQCEAKDQILSHNYFGWREKEDNTRQSNVMRESSTNQGKSFMQIKKIGVLSYSSQFQKPCYGDSPHGFSKNSIKGQAEMFLKQQNEDSCQIYEGNENISLTTEYFCEEESAIKDITSIKINNKFN